MAPGLAGRGPPTVHPIRPSPSAREDAITPARRPSARTTTLILAALAGISLGVVVALVTAPASLPLFRARVPWTGGPPADVEWPEAAQPGEGAALARLARGRHGPELEVQAPRAPRARRLAAGLAARRSAGVAALGQAYAAVSDRWRAGLMAAPLPPMTPQAECASLLFADASRRRDLAQALPAPYAGPAPELVVTPALPEAEAVAAAAAAADPERCRRALLALATAEDARFAAGVPARDASAAVRGAAWQGAQRERADSLDALAARTLEGQTGLQKELAKAAGAQLVTLANALGDPYAPLSAITPAPPVRAEALPGPWAALLGFGAGLGGLVGLCAALLGLWLRRGAPRAAKADPQPPLRDPGALQPWLHVVAGPNENATVRGALELAAHALARHARVLLVDAGAGRLHERLGREARWGLMECLQGDMPVLGLVQYAGRPGFYLLARGHAARTAAWAGLGRCLDDARQHFGRVVFVVDRSTAREFGDALAGRPLEGWWAGAHGRPAAGAAELSARFGIAFSGMDLAFVLKASLEALGARVSQLATTLPPTPVVTPHQAGAPEPLAPAPAPVPDEPIVLECDLQVLQRLRFLAWMRRVQSEGQPAELRTAPR